MATHPTHDDGVIKFNCDWQRSGPIECDRISPLIHWRDQMFAAGIIGVYPDGIGYGNISLRDSPDTFLVSGTQTGHLEHTTPQHYTRVHRWDIPQNTLQCCGPVAASSESLTHAALYQYSPTIQAIIHGHHPQLWHQYKDVLPTTRAEVPYGTPAMAAEMWRLLDRGLRRRRILVMAGHEDGLLAFGDSLAAAAQVFLELLAPCSDDHFD